MKTPRIILAPRRPALESEDVIIVEPENDTVAPVEPEGLVDEVVDDIDIGYCENPPIEEVGIYQKAADVVEGTLQEGGLSLEAASLLNVFNAHYGVRVSPRVSNESYGTSGIYESKVAVEGIKEFIDNWWNRFKEWLVRASKKVEEWTVSVMVKISNLENKGKLLVEQSSNAQPGPGNIEFKSAPTIAIKGQVTGVVQGISTLASFAESHYKTIVEAGFSTAESLNTSLQGVSIQSEADVDVLVNKLSQGIAMPWVPYKTVLTQAVQNDAITNFIMKGNPNLQGSTFASPDLLGNAIIVGTEFALRRSESSADTLRDLSGALKYSSVQILLEEDRDVEKWKATKTEEGQNSSVPRLSPNDVRSVGESLQKLGAALTKTKEIVADKRQADNYLTQAGEAIAGMNIDESIQGADGIASSLRSIVASTGALVQSPLMRVALYLLAVGGAVEEYARLSLGQEKESRNSNESAVPEELAQYFDKMGSENKVSLEAAGDTLKDLLTKAYEWVKRQLIAFAAYAEDHFDIILDRLSYNGRLKARLEKLKGSITNKSLAIKKDTVTFVGSGRLKNEAGDLKTVSVDFSKGVDVLRVIADFYVTKIPALSKQCGSKFKEGLESGDGTVVSAVNRSVVSLFEGNLGRHFTESNDQWLSPALPGNKKVGFELINAAEDNRVLKVRWLLEEIENESNANVVESVPPLNFNSITSGLTGVESVTQFLDKIKTSAESLRNELKATKALVAAVEKGAKGDKSDETLALVRRVNEFLELQKGLSLKGIAGIVSYYGSTANAYLSYIESSVGKLKEV